MSEHSYKWAVHLVGDDADLAFLAAIFRSSDLLIQFDEKLNGYFCFSDNFHCHLTNQDVFDLASNAALVLLGILKFTCKSRGALTLGGVYKIHLDGRRDCFINISEIISIRATAGEVVAGNNSSSKLPLQVSIFKLSNHDKEVERAMRLIAAHDFYTWVGLYRLFELICADAGGKDSIVAQNWCSVSQITRFKHSSNSVSVAGDSARHGIESSLPPSNPITLTEAIEFINGLLDRWLASKKFDEST